VAALAQAAAGDAPKRPAKSANKTPAKSGVIAVVNGVPIPASRAEVLLREREAQGAPDNPAMKEAVRQDLINREIIAQEAARTGYTKKPALQAELDLVRQTVIVQHYVADWLHRHPVTDAEVKKAYDDAKAQSGGMEYKVRHILLPTEDQAKEVIAALDKGAKFEDLAKKSKDEGTREHGGELGWMTPGNNLAEGFTDAMKSLGKGKYTEKPVHTRFGYHVIQVEDERPMKFPPLDDVKPRIEQQLNQVKLRELVEGLRAKAKIQ
jgi:peptidyl-prolyl cis-trans isomerase C